MPRARCSLLLATHRPRHLRLATGTLSREETEKVLKLWNVPVDAEELDTLFAKCDKDGDGNISYKESMAGLAR